MEWLNESPSDIRDQRISLVFGVREPQSGRDSSSAYCCAQTVRLPVNIYTSFNGKTFNTGSIPVVQNLVSKIYILASSSVGSMRWSVKPKVVRSSRTQPAIAIQQCIAFQWVGLFGVYYKVQNLIAYTNQAVSIGGPPEPHPVPLSPHRLVWSQDTRFSSSEHRFKSGWGERRYEQYLHAVRRVFTKIALWSLFLVME